MFWISKYWVMFGFGVGRKSREGSQGLGDFILLKQRNCCCTRCVGAAGARTRFVYDVFFENDTDSAVLRGGVYLFCEGQVVCKQYLLSCVEGDGNY